MDVTSAAWLSELEMEGSHDFNNQHQITYPFTDAFSCESLTHYDHPYSLRMNKSPSGNHIEQDMVKRPESHHLFAPNQVSSSNTTFIMTFGNPNSPPEMNPHPLAHDDSCLKYSTTTALLKPREEWNWNTKDFSGFVEGAKSIPSTRRNLTQAQDHVLAERKRRELLTRHFISLSALLPNLKKMDKGSVLEDATKYIKQLQIRMKELEEETAVKGKNFRQESAVSIGRYKISGDGNDDDEMKSPVSGDIFDPEIEVRISESSVLVRIYSHKNSSVVGKTLSELKRLHLTINSSSVISFSTTALLITITAQMSEEIIVMTAADVVKSLQSAIRKFVSH